MTAPISSFALPSPPFLDVPGLANFRDAGGYALADDPTRMVRRNLLFRSSEPSQVTEQGIRTITEKLGITHVYDLRSKTEIDKDTASGKRQVREWNGSQRIFAPVFAVEDYSPEAIARRFTSFAQEGSQGFVQVYDRILAAAVNPTGCQPFATILRHLAQPNPSPILIHCTAGKDRTGVIIALILSLCGVSDAAISYDYSLTDLGLFERKKEFIAHLLEEEPLRGNRAGVERMVSSRAENMMGTLKMMRDKWGGAEAFVREQVGLSQEEVEAVRKNLVAGVGNGEGLIPWEEQAKLML